MIKNEYYVIGLMSGSSTDGLDIAYCKFVYENERWHYDILEAECIPYSPGGKQKFPLILKRSQLLLQKANAFYGQFLGKTTAKFIKKYELQGKVDFVASHGHTMYHEPAGYVTVQIGSGAVIASILELPVVCDFRSTDVARYGNGAPLVPIGDKYLFADHTFCLNIGGIVNISAKLPNEKMIGFDVCAGNLLLNWLAKKLNYDYDDEGKIASKGKVTKALLKDLNEVYYSDKPYPKSLSADWVLVDICGIVDKHRHLSYEYKLRTAVEYIAEQVGNSILNIAEREKLSLTDTDTMLITGGGALNKFLVSRIMAHSPVKVVVPDRSIIDFKEALIMAFMGVLRMRETPNCLSSVTGATKDSIGGCVYLG